MIELAAPAFLGALAALPLLVWLHRLEPRPPVETVPSLLFLAGEPASPERPARRAFDLDLVLALLAAAALALAAARPVASAVPAARRIVCLRDVGPAMDARSSDGTRASDRAAAAIAALRARPGAPAEPVVVDVAGDELARRLRDGTGGLRVLVSDRRPAELPRGVVFVGVGDPSAVNAGIVAVDAVVEAGVRRIGATVWNDAATARRLAIGAEGVEQPVLVPAFGAVRASIRVDEAGGAAGPVRLHLIDEGGALSSDDLVTLDFAPVRVAFDAGPGGPSPAVVSATKRALSAVLPGGWIEAAEGARGVWFGDAAHAPPGFDVVEVGCVPPGVDPVRPAAGATFGPSDPEATRDVRVDAFEWVYRPGPAARPPFERVTRARIGTAGALLTRWHADPGLGRPAAVDGPYWPIFIDNVVHRPGTRSAGAASRVEGLLDVTITRLGRDRVPPDDRALDDGARESVGARHELGPALAVVGTICLALLWFRPRKGAGRPVG